MYPGAIMVDVPISDPSEPNVKDASSGLFFTTSTFMNRTKEEEDASLSTSASPKKKRKMELEENVEKRWLDAVAKMDSYKGGGDSGGEESNDEEELGMSSSPSPSNMKKRQGNGEGREVPPPGEDDDWTPPEADDTLEIPGELVIARDKQSSNTYWPAKILAYVPPPRPKTKNRKGHAEGKYRVLYLDRSEKDIVRAWFCAPTDPGFGHCVVSP